MNRQGPRGLLQAKAPELLLEAFFVVFAVLVALGVDEWNESRDLREKAETARAAVLSELEGNWEELKVGGPSTVEMMESVTATVQRLRRGEAVTQADIQGVLPDFSDAAWETARVTGAVARMDYDWVLRTARLYQTQELTLGLQRDLLGTIGGLAVRAPELERFLDFRGQLAILTMLHQELDRKYMELLAPDSLPSTPPPDSVGGALPDQ